MERLIQDLRFTLRQIRLRPGFTLVAVLTLAIGIGPNTAIFSLVHAILLRSLPFHQPQELVQIRKTVFPKGWLLALRKDAKSFEGLAAYSRNDEFNLNLDGQSYRLVGAFVSANFFDTLGVQPEHGRLLAKDEDMFGQDRVVVLSYSLWQQNFGSDPRVVGKVVEVEGIPRQVIGVMPAEFRFPTEQTDLWIPNPVKPASQTDLWSVQNLYIFGRLKANVTAAEAFSELKVLQPRLNAMFPWSMPKDFGMNIEVASLAEVVQGNMRLRLLILFGTVFLVLLIACANIAGIFLGRAASRRKEIAVRLAVGASRRRLLQQFLTESVSLALLGGLLGVALGWWGIRFLKYILPPETPRLSQAHLNPEVLIFTLLLSLLVGLVLGLVPGIAFLSQNVQRSLKDNEATAASQPVKNGFSTGLVMGQIALAVVIVAGTGVMARSLWKLLQVDPGYRTTRTVFAQVGLDKSACRTTGACESFFRTFLDRLRGQAGVDNVAVVNQPVLHGTNRWFGFDAEGYQRGPRDPLPQGVEHIVLNDYFGVMGIPLVAGRSFTDADKSGNGGPVIVSSSLARRFWPNSDAVGKHLTPVAAKQQREIVGVAGDTRYTSLDTEGGYEVYVPFGADDISPVMTVAVRTSADVSTATREIRDTVAGLNRLASVSKIETIGQVINASTLASRGIFVLLSLFAFVAVALSSIGIYSLNYYLVSWRAREIGIRMALGATPQQVTRSVVIRALAITVTGMIIGVLLALGTTQLFKSYLFEVNPLDPVTFVTIPVLFVMISILATWVPARRAAAVDPVNSLRYE